MPKGEPAKKKRKNMVSSSDSDSDENTATHVNDKTALLDSSNSDSEDGKSIGTNDAISESSSAMRSFLKVKWTEILKWRGL